VDVRQILIGIVVEV